MAAAFISPVSTGVPDRDVTVPSGADLMVLVILNSDPQTRTAASFDGDPLDAAELDNVYASIFYMLAPPVGTTGPLLITPNTFVSTNGMIVLFYSTDTSGFTFQSGQQAAAASASYSPSGAAVIVHGISAVSTSGTPVASTNERVDTGGSWVGDRIVTGSGSVTVGVSSATDPDYAGAIFLEASSGADLTATAAFSAGAASMATTASRGRDATAAFAASAATMATTASRGRAASAAFAAGAAALAATSVLGHPATAGFSAGPASMAAEASVSGNREVSVASFAAGPATMATSAARARTASAAFAAADASLSASAAITTERTISVASFAASSASMSATASSPVLGIVCAQPRPKLNLPGYTPPRLAWRPPAIIAGLPANAARALQQAFQSIYQEMSKVGQRRTIVPLYEDIDARDGQIIVGIGAGQTIRLPLLPNGQLGQVGIVLTDVSSPVTVINPDGTTQSLGVAGAYDFVSGSPEVFQTSPGGTVLGGGIPTDRLLGRDTAGTGAVESISVTGGLEFSGSQSLRIADLGVTTAKLANANVTLPKIATQATDTIIANVTSGTASPTAVALTTLANNSLSWDATNKRYDYVGSTSVINITPAGAVGVVDISTLLCGGQVTVQPSGNFNVDGFTAMPTGFWFDLVYRDATAFVGTLNENGGATTTSIRNPGGVASTFTTQECVRLKWMFNRWRIVSKSTRPLSALFPGAPIYDVMAPPFNAAANGTTDDTAAINAAIAAANAVPGVIYLGDNHRITAGLDPITSDGITIRGRGRFDGGTVLRVDAASAPTAVIHFDGCNYGGIEDVWIRAVGALYGSGCAILFDECLRGHASRCFISQFFNGIEVFESALTDIELITFDDLYGEFGIRAYGNGSSCHTTYISRCYAGNNFTTAVTGDVEAWQSGTAYALGNVVMANGNAYQAVTAGTSGATAPSGLPGATTATAHTATIADGSVAWAFAMPLITWFWQDSYASTFRVIDCAAVGGGYALRVTDTLGDAPQFTRVMNLECDHLVAGGVVLDGGNQAEFEQLFVTSIYSGHAVEITANHNGNWRFDGGLLFGISQEAMVINASEGSLSDFIIGGAGSAAVNTYDAVSVGASVEHFSITDCTIGVIHGDETPQTRYGISVAAGCDNYIIAGNRLIGHDTGAILNTPGVSATRIVRNNIPDTANGLIPDGDYGDITVSSSGTVWNIDPNVVGDSEIRQSAGLSVIARQANTTGNVADITASVASSLFKLNNSGTALVWGQAATASIEDDAVTNAKSADMAANTFKANVTGSTADPTDHSLTTFAGGGLTYTSTTGIMAVGAGTGITVNANDVAVTIPLTDGDKGDITVASSGTSWTIDANAVTDAKFRQSAGLSVVARQANSTGNVADITASSAGTVFKLNNAGTALVWGQVGTAGLENNAVTNAAIRDSGALSVIGRSANSSGDPADISTTAASGAVLRESGGALGFGTVATAGIADDAITNAKAANMAQSTIKGRAEGAGTGDPTDLTPSQVVAIIDGESPTWTGSHAFTGSGSFTVDLTSDVSIASNTGGLWLSSGHTAVASPSVSNGDVLINASSGVAINADATAVSAVSTGNVAVTGTVFSATTTGGDILLASGNNVTISAVGSIAIPSPSELGSPTFTGASFRSAVFSSTMAGDLNNLAIGGVSVVRLDVNSATDRTLTGMVPQGDGHVVYIFNTATTAGRLILANNTGSTAENRFLAPGTNHAIRPRGGVAAWYDGASDRWRLMVDSETDLS